MNDIYVFSAFGVLQIVFHYAHKATGMAVIAKLSQHHYVVWLFHPVVVHTAQDFVVHWVVYGGHVISTM